MLFLFFLGYTILAALKLVAYFLLVVLVGIFLTNNYKLGSGKCPCSTVLHAKENLLFGRCCAKDF